jgi:uncharacterized protein YpuA (DUF1002 family)
MNNTVEEYKRIKNQQERLQRDYDKTQGQLEQLLQNLKDMGFPDEVSAVKELGKLKTEYELISKKLSTELLSAEEMMRKLNELNLGTASR